MSRAQGLLCCGLALGVAMSSLLLPALTEGGELLLTSGLILSLGVPHGALDTIFAHQVYRLRTPRAWVLAAIICGGLAASVMCAWLISPTVFLIGILLLSIAHFAGDPGKGVRAFTAILYAGMVIVLPCLRFEPGRRPSIRISRWADERDVTCRDAGGAGVAAACMLPWRSGR